MASSVNKVILVGRLGRDPEVFETGKQQTKVSFSVATNERWKDKNSGEMKERTEWHNVVVWGNLALLCRDYLHKGSQVYLEGRLQSREYDDKDKIKRKVVEVVADEVVFLTAKGQGTGGGSGDEYSGGGGGGSRGGRPVGPAEPAVADDDIPF